MKTLLSAVSALAFALAAAATSSGAFAATPDDINHNSTAALQQLYATNPAARAISEHARAILIFPKMVKAGLVVGAAYGQGELMQGSGIDGYYESVTASVGLQAGYRSPTLLRRVS